MTLATHRAAALPAWHRLTGTPAGRLGHGLLLVAIAVGIIGGQVWQWWFADDAGVARVGGVLGGVIWISASFLLWFSTSTFLAQTAAQPASLIVPAAATTLRNIAFACACMLCAAVSGYYGLLHSAWVLPWIVTALGCLVILLCLVNPYIGFTMVVLFVASCYVRPIQTREFLVFSDWLVTSADGPAVITAWILGVGLSIWLLISIQFRVYRKLAAKLKFCAGLK